ncbi:MAG TPA: cytochrome P450 [Ilumatobacteraceae bacterium]|nr:cytochrome P450 [Ilumatobacteraceae bacterium]
MVATTFPHRSADPRDPSFYADPYRWYTELHTSEATTFFWEQYGFWCVAGFDDANALLRDKRFGRAPGLPERTERIANWWETERWSLLAIDPPEHTQLRGLVNRAFLSRRIEQLRPRIRELAAELIDRFEGDASVDLLPRYAAPLPAIVIAEMIGLPGDMAPQLLAWSNSMVKMYMFGVDEAVETEADRAAAEFVVYLTDVLAERRADPQPDLLSHMLDAEIDGARLSDAEVIATTILLLNAGHEATVHTTGNAVATILRSGGDPAVLFASDEQAEATVEECLRFDAPLHLFTRYALDDVELDSGLRLRRGEQIGIMLGAANRDPRRFERPDVFDPFRTDGGNVSFGAGIHFCIGAPLARLELATSLRLLFERLPALRLVDEPQYRDIFHFHGLDAVTVTW